MERWGEDEDEASAAEESKRRMKHQPDGGLKEEERNGMHALPWLSKCVFIWAHFPAVVCACAKVNKPPTPNPLPHLLPGLSGEHQHIHILWLNAEPSLRRAHNREYKKSAKVAYGSRQDTHVQELYCRIRSGSKDSRIHRAVRLKATQMVGTHQ